MPALKQFHMRSIPIIISIVLSSLMATGSFAADIRSSLKAIHEIGKEGAGNEAAMDAWQQLSQSSVQDLPQLILGMNGGSPLSNNWIRLAVQTVIDRNTRSETGSQSVPVIEILAILSDRENSAATRTLAYDVLSSANVELAQSLSREFANDPALPLRRLTIAGLIERARNLKADGMNDQALAVFQQALASARDIDQIESVVTELNAMGQDQTVAQALGFLQDWKIIGPFHNNNREGFEDIFPPEKNIALNSKYPGKNGEVSWQEFVSKDSYGKVDVNEAIAALKEVTAYAYREFDSPVEQVAELRLGCKNAWKIWFNGEFIFGRDEYHRGAQIDQYVFPVTLKKGPNKILIKLCQNEQTESWTREWEFQFRICDPLGTALAESSSK